MRERPRSIAGNYLVGKRYVNTVFPRLFCALLLPSSSLPSILLYLSIYLLHCLCTVCARSLCIPSQARRISSPAFRLPCLLLHYVLRYICSRKRTAGKGRAIVIFDKKCTCTKVDNHIYFSTL